MSFSYSSSFSFISIVPHFCASLIPTFSLPISFLFNSLTDTPLSFAPTFSWSLHRHTIFCSPLSSSPHFLGFSLPLSSTPSCVFLFPHLCLFLSPPLHLSLRLSSSLSFVFFPCCVLMQNGMFYASYVSTYPCLVKQVSPSCSLTSVMCFQPSLLMSSSSSPSVTSFFLAFFGDTCFVFKT